MEGCSIEGKSAKQADLRTTSAVTGNVAAGSTH